MATSAAIRKWGGRFSRILAILAVGLFFLPAQSAPMKPPLMLLVEGLDEDGNGRIDAVEITFDQLVDIWDGNGPGLLGEVLGAVLGGGGRQRPENGGGNPNDGFPPLELKASEGPNFEIAPGDYSTNEERKKKFFVRERPVAGGDTGVRITAIYHAPSGPLTVPTYIAASEIVNDLTPVEMQMLDKTQTTEAQYVDGAPPAIIRIDWKPLDDADYDAIASQIPGIAKTYDEQVQPQLKPVEEQLPSSVEKPIDVPLQNDPTKDLQIPNPQQTDQTVRSQAVQPAQEQQDAAKAAGKQQYADVRAALRKIYSHKYVVTMSEKIGIRSLLTGETINPVEAAKGNPLDGTQIRNLEDAVNAMADDVRYGRFDPRKTFRSPADHFRFVRGGLISQKGTGAFDAEVLDGQVHTILQSILPETPDDVKRARVRSTYFFRDPDKLVEAARKQIPKEGPGTPSAGPDGILKYEDTNFRIVRNGADAVLDQQLKILTILPGPWAPKPAIHGVDTNGDGHPLYDPEWTRNDWLQAVPGMLTDLPVAKPNFGDQMPPIHPANPGEYRDGNPVAVGNDPVPIGIGGSFRVKSVRTLDVNGDGKVDCYKIKFCSLDGSVDVRVKDLSLKGVLYNDMADPISQFRTPIKPGLWTVDINDVSDPEGFGRDVADDETIYFRLDPDRSPVTRTDHVGDFVCVEGFIRNLTGDPVGPVAAGAFNGTDDPEELDAIDETDGAAPALLSVRTADIAPKNGLIDRLRLTWSEPVVDASVNFLLHSCNELLIKDNPETGYVQEVRRAPADIDTPDVQFISVEEFGDYNSGVIPLSYETLRGFVQDVHGNLSRRAQASPHDPYVSAPLVVDGAPPEIVKASGVAKKNLIRVEFSEPVYTNPGGGGNLQIVDFRLDDIEGRSITGVTFTAGARRGTLTLSFPLSRETFDAFRLFPREDQIFDLSGNPALTDRIGLSDPSNSLQDIDAFLEGVEGAGGAAGAGGSGCFLSAAAPAAPILPAAAGWLAALLGAAAIRRSRRR